MVQSSDEDLRLAEDEQELPPGVAQKKKSGQLRTGFTTGTTASAATKAALGALLNGREDAEVNVTLPKGSVARIPIAWTRREKDSVTSAAIKDGGDDPDVTHGAEICSTVSLTGSPGEIVIDGGDGVGRVTKPGLGLQIGKAAINPVPERMIEYSAQEVAGEHLARMGIKIVISVPKGAEIAKKTDNPRLGILGGISILGTTGIVLPYSTASFAASIRQGIDVLMASGGTTAVLTTGSRSEEFVRSLYGHLPEQSFIQMGDFAGFSVLQCAKKGVPNVIVCGFIGKLTKIAKGVKQTHVAGSNVDMEFMARIALECGASAELADEIRRANTARHVSEIISARGISGYFDAICKRAHEQLTAYSKGVTKIEIIMFEFDGLVIGRYPK